MSRPALTFRPTLSNSDHRKAWELLQAVPKRRRGEYIVQAILRDQEKNALEDILREVVREELDRRCAQGTGPSQRKKDVQEEVPKQMLAFLELL